MSDTADLQPEVTTFYKFRPFSTEEDKRRFREIVLGHRVFFPPPAAFNDPFDPRPRIVVRSREKILYRYVKRARESFGPNSSAERNILKANVPAMASALTEKYQRMIREEAGVLSLAGTREEILLWSHYAGNHSGLCIHFRRGVFPFYWFHPVRYTNEYPALEVPLDDQHNETFVRLFCTKAVTWSYEREFRFIMPPPQFGAEIDIGLEWDGRHLTIPAEAISGVTLGALISPIERSEVAEICRARSPPLEVWQASLHDSMFALTFERIA